MAILFPWPSNQKYVQCNASHLPSNPLVSYAQLITIWYYFIGYLFFPQAFCIDVKFKLTIISQFLLPHISLSRVYSGLWEVLTHINRTKDNQQGPTVWKVLVAQSCLTVYNSIDYSPPGSSVHGILQARTLEWKDKDHYNILTHIYGI